MKKDRQINQMFIAKGPTPVLNVPDFSLVFGGKEGTRLLEDEKGHIRALEFIALKNTLFEVLDNLENTNIYKVYTPSYSATNLFVDKRFLQPMTNLKENKKNTINESFIISDLEKRLGYPYLWGGNYYKGIPKLLKYYPPSSSIPLNYKKKWMLQGVDCSGLLYEVTNGLTPRNTKELLLFGNFIEIENLSISDIIKKLRPLDLIVFPGHLIIIKDLHYTIESRENKGVILTAIHERFSELLEKRIPSNNTKNTNDYFVIKRWIN